MPPYQDKSTVSLWSVLCTVRRTALNQERTVVRILFRIVPLWAPWLFLDKHILLLSLSKFIYALPNLAIYYCNNSRLGPIIMTRCSLIFRLVDCQDYLTELLSLKIRRDFEKGVRLLLFSLALHKLNERHTLQSYITYESIKSPRNHKWEPITASIKTSFPHGQHIKPSWFKDYAKLVLKHDQGQKSLPHIWRRSSSGYPSAASLQPNRNSLVIHPSWKAVSCTNLIEQKFTHMFFRCMKLPQTQWTSQKYTNSQKKTYTTPFATFWQPTSKPQNPKY